MTLTRLDNHIRATLGESGLTSGPCSNTELLKIHTEIRAGLRNTPPAPPAGGSEGTNGQNHNETLSSLLANAHPTQETLLKIHTQIRAGLRDMPPAAPAGPGGSGGQNHNETIIRSRH